MIEASVPRMKCPAHGVKQVPVLWAEKNSRFTTEFECAVLLWLKEDPISTVAQHSGKAVDKVRAQESRLFLKAGNGNPLNRIKYQWLGNSDKIDNSATKRKEFLKLTQTNLKTARAWRIK